MASEIHSTAIIHPQAKIGTDVEIGPYCVIDDGVYLGDRCRLGPNVYLTGQTQIGPDNSFHSGCVIGDAPQDISYSGAPTRTVIGSGNTFRESVTIQRSNSEEEATTIGSENFFMATSHAGHNARIGNRNVLANSTLIGGHAIIEDQVIFGGNSAVHQFVRVGRLAMLQGHSGLSQDLPPFLINSRINELSGLNAIGMRRAGIPAEDRSELKRLFHLFFRQGHALQHALQLAADQFSSPASAEFLDFIRGSRRGICSKTRR